MKIGKPSKQGVLDGACGFYATTHALSILAPSLSREYIFEAVIRSAMQDTDPMRFVIGTSRGTIKNTLSRTISLLNKAFGVQLGAGYYSFIPYWQTAPINRKEFFKTFEGIDHKSGKVAILGYSYKPTSNSLDHAHHWTVIREFKDNGLVTYDSSGQKKIIPVSEVRVNDTHNEFHSSQPYFINSDDLFLVLLL
ncbi:hypothetical protein [Propionivibrio sp.]|uniref:hypothetical protein n=1 Tax=Propionivibrio sp. TaxID=2212460 RepID=UPI003BF10AB8